MSKGVNTCIFIGNLGKDPEVKTTGGGMSIANFSLAVNDREKVNGEWKDVTEWVNAVAFGKTAEIIGQYARKGSKLYISGKLKTRSWLKDDVKQYRTEVIVNELSLLSEGKPAALGNATASAWAEPDESNIPF